MRHRFLNDEAYRKTRLSHPKLPSRMAVILKKMLNENPQKRYEDLPMALRKIGKVRANLASID